jgi:hypothetical protein
VSLRCCQRKRSHVSGESNTHASRRSAHLVRLDQRLEAAHVDQSGLPFFVTRTRRVHVLAKCGHSSVSQRAKDARSLRRHGARYTLVARTPWDHPVAGTPGISAAPSSLAAARAPAQAMRPLALALWQAGGPRSASRALLAAAAAAAAALSDAALSDVLLSCCCCCCCCCCYGPTDQLHPVHSAPFGSRLVKLTPPPTC